MTNTPWWTYTIILACGAVIVWGLLVAFSKIRQGKASSGEGKPPARSSTLARVADKVRRTLAGASKPSPGEPAEAQKPKEEKKP
jgi:hypothetical protein